LKAGNVYYSSAKDVPDIVSVFPVAGVLLLPGGHLPLNVFEERYLSLVDDAIASNRMIGMIQPADFKDVGPDDAPELCRVGCLGRILSHRETGDGRYLIGLAGICRFKVLAMAEPNNGYRRCRISNYINDMNEDEDVSKIDRETLLKTFRNYLDANGMQADWDSVSKTSCKTLVTALSMMSPFGPAEKQALLEASDMKNRADTLVALTEIALARDSNGPDRTLQ